jgi:hypothetical protein
VEPTQLGPIDRASPYLQSPKRSIKRTALLDKERMMDNVQKQNVCRYILDDNFRIILITQLLCGGLLTRFVLDIRNCIDTYSSNCLLTEMESYLVHS